MSPRPITSPEITLLGSEGQGSLLKLAFAHPKTILAARINQAFLSRDKITSVMFDTVTAGSYTNIVPGMTVWIGSAPGKCDVGICRVRTTATSNRIYIGETSEVYFTDNQYITVINEYGIWAKHLAIAPDKTALMDLSIAYTNQHSVMLPVVVMGPHAVIKIVEGIASLPRSASDSWYINSDGDIDHGLSYLWSCPDASTIMGSTTANATFLFDTVGTFTISCRVTASGSLYAYGYRNVVVYDDEHPLVSNFVAEDIQGSKSDGGWQFNVTMYDNVSSDLVANRVLVMLVAEEEWYGEAQANLNVLPGNNNVIALGWIDGATINYDIEKGNVGFSVRGPQFWLKQETCFPLGIEDTTGTATAWTNIHNMTVDKMLWHQFVWRSTLALCLDCTVTYDQKFAAGFVAEIGSIWQQIVTVAESSIFATPLFDRYGRLFVEVDPQYVPNSSRTSIPVVMTIDDSNLVSSVKVTKTILPSVAKVFLSGIIYYAGIAYSLFSLAPGHIFKRIGNIITFDKLLLSDQTSANELTGMALAKKNNPYPSIPVSLAQNNRMFDICPVQYVDLVLSADDTPLGEGINSHAIPNDVKFVFDGGTGNLHTELVLEVATIYTPGITGDLPPTSPPIVTPPFPRIHVRPPFPRPPTPPGGGGAAVYALSVDFGLFYTESFGSATPSWFAKNTGGPGDTTKVTQMDIDTHTRQVYVAGTDGLWGGPLGDEYMIGIIDQIWLDREFPTGGLDSSIHAHIGAFGINSSAGGVSMIAIGTGYESTRKAYIYFGNPSALIRKAELHWEWIDNWFCGQITYSAGAWLLTCPGFIDRNTWAKLNSDGSTVLASAHFASPYAGTWHIRAGATNNVYTRIGGDLGYSTNDNITVTSLGFNADITTPSGLNSICACSDNGANLLAHRVHGTFERSSDYGVTWEVLTDVPTGVIWGAVANMHDPDKWVIAGVTSTYLPAIYYSNDFGETWSSKTGNLGDLIPVCNNFHKLMAVV